MRDIRSAVVFALALASCYAANARVLTEGPWLDVSNARLEPESAGKVQRRADGWVEWKPSAPGKGKYKEVQLRMSVLDVRFRAFNQFYVEVDSGNEGFEVDIRLLTALPKHGELKLKKNVKRGMNSFELHFPGVGAPARLREVRMSVAREAMPSLTAAVKVRCKMRLTYYNHDKTIGGAVEESLAHKPAGGFAEGELAAGEAVRAKLKSRAESLRRTVDDERMSNSSRIRGYEGLCEIRDGAPWRIEQACFDVAAAADRAKGIILHGVATGADKVARSDVFCGKVRGKASVSLARGESEGVQVVLYPDVPVNGLRWAVSPLRSSDGTLLPGSCVSLSPVGYITTTEPAYIPPRQFRETAPDPILSHVSSLDLEPRRFQPFFLDVTAQSNTRPGTYTGTVAFRDSTKKLVARVPLSVVVHPFELPRARTFPMVFSSPTFSPKNPLLKLYANDKDIAQYKSFIEGDDGDASKQPDGVKRLWMFAYKMHKMLKDHNIPTQDIYASVRKVEPAWLRNLQVADSPNWYCLGYDNAGPIVEKVRAHIEPMRADGISKAAYLYGFDEIRMSDTRAFQGMKRDYGAVKAAYPEVRTMCTALDGSFGVKSDTEQEVDCWVWPSDGYAGSRKNAERARARGKQVWYYPCNWPYHPHANLHLESLGTGTRVLCGLYAWKYKADGMLYYATAMSKVQTTSRENGFESEKRIEDPKILPGGPLYGIEHCYSMFRSNGDGMLVYPGPDGVLPCLRLKEIRDGVDDYEYLVLLDAAAKKVRAGTVKVSNSRDFLSEAEELLLVADDLCRGDSHYPETGVPILAWRARVAKLLDATVVAERGRK